MPAILGHIPSESERMTKCDRLSSLPSSHLIDKLPLEIRYDIIDRFIAAAALTQMLKGWERPLYLQGYTQFIHCILKRLGMPADDLEPKPKEWVPLWLDALDLAWDSERSGTWWRSFKVEDMWQMWKEQDVHCMRAMAPFDRLGGLTMQEVEEVNLFKDDGTVIHFDNPKVQASIEASTYVVSGNANTKKLQDMFSEAFSGPGWQKKVQDMVCHLGYENLPTLTNPKELKFNLNPDEGWDGVA